MADESVLKELVTELDVVKTWFSPGSARHGKVATIADKLAEAVGGRPELAAGDPNQPTPGPGVRAAQTTEVDSVGQVAEVDPAEQRRAAAKAAADAAQQKQGDQPPAG